MIGGSRPLPPPGALVPHSESQEPANKDQDGQEQQPQVETPGRVAQEPDHLGTDEPAEVPDGADQCDPRRRGRAAQESRQE